MIVVESQNFITVYTKEAVGVYYPTLANLSPFPFQEIDDMFQKKKKLINHR
jgi:hypothetical protein